MELRENDKNTSLLGLLVILVTVYLLYSLATTSTKLSTTASVLLAVLTALYVFFTYQILSETNRHREQDIQPAFAVDIKRNHLEVKNVGNGPALDTELKLEIIPNPEEWSTGSSETSNLDVPAGDSVRFTQQPFDSFGQHLSMGNISNAKLHLKGNYLDIYQNRKQIRERTYDLEPYTEKNYPRERDRDTAGYG